MGFTTGFIGGITLTTTILYLSISAHRHNRTVQAHALRQQSTLLNSIFEPPAPITPEQRRPRKISFAETLKDRWNEEIEGLVRSIQRTDWGAVRGDAENAAGRIWTSARDKLREEKGSS
ncbi:MAG: hypothetical protein M4579_004573 [Chaenotheca gracillima]|nr:MAG: hypothetical protein M4579_004573 [Chaenotheca gracillima]